MIGLQAAFLQQLLNIPRRQRITKIPADSTENERRFRLPQLKDRRSRSNVTILSGGQPGPKEVATQPSLLSPRPRPDKYHPEVVRSTARDEIHVAIRFEHIVAADSGKP